MQAIVELLAPWLRCPSCGSSDVTISISFPETGVSVVCDDCRRRDHIDVDDVVRGEAADHHPASDE
ncbi:hypothetical protein [Halosimplex halobium]|uniref:hypothetical protein n=1 Tax=Halosimplex halobium TaxID=3396618 RepID=UPI003F5556EC